MNKVTIFAIVIAFGMMTSISAQAGGLRTWQPHEQRGEQYYDDDLQRRYEKQKWLNQQRKIEEALTRQAEAIERQNRIQREILDRPRRRLELEEMAKEYCYTKACRKDKAYAKEQLKYFQ